MERRSQPRQGPDSTNVSPWVFVLLGGVGVAVIVLAAAMRRGASSWVRMTLTVVGCLFAFGLWPMLLVIPAIVLQFKAPSNAWFTALAGNAAEARTGPAQHAQHPGQHNRPPEGWHQPDERYWQGR
ncbi:MAG: hypothetical protein GEV07_12605 [Streptosporangiales bacterium]|nr:hypothetical protein [Streptosporangiales bacterium]